MDCRAAASRLIARAFHRSLLWYSPGPLCIKCNGDSVIIKYSHFIAAVQMSPSAHRL